MEDTLREEVDTDGNPQLEGLNPCFNGRYSQRTENGTKEDPTRVLILVLMEDTLREYRATP